tara:strand:+ start:529 stop:1215 length:687 start_codon:yes stop_codon:yes gene_type:complete
VGGNAANTTVTITGGGGGGISTVLNNEVRYVAYNSSQFVEIKNTGTLYAGLSWSQSGTTVTVTSTAHGLTNGDYIVVRGGADSYLYREITFIDVDTFTYTSATTATITGTDGAYVPAARVVSIDDDQATIASPSAGDIQIGYIKYINATTKFTTSFDLTLPQGINNGVGGNNSFETQSPPTSIVFAGDGTYNSAATIQVKGIGGSNFNVIQIPAGLNDFAKNIVIFTF